jgi:putative protease
MMPIPKPAGFNIPQQFYLFGAILQTMSGERPVRIPELLAPAGSPEALRAAVAAGADAVYLGGRRFGARRFASNFSNEDLAAAVDYAHTHGVKVYVTVNTLLRDRELEDAAGFLDALYRMGVDAVLVQDPGLVELARNVVPGLELHASTQMTILTREGVRWAQEHGLSRVVLARELGLDVIRELLKGRNSAMPGLEIFIHGALCYSYSGQCLLSSVIGGRSGNRGMCAQPCRKPYRLVEADIDRYGRPVNPQKISCAGGYPLSTRDLSTLSRIGELAGSGIGALKIEGRMRSPEYVAIAVSLYRKALDSISRGEPWAPGEEDTALLMLAFNRGFSCGYLFGCRGVDLMGRERPDNRGVPVGRVTGCGSRGEIFIKNPLPTIKIRKGDGLMLFDPRTGKEYGLVLKSDPVYARGELRFPGPRECREGMDLWLTRSNRLREIASDILSNPVRRAGFPIPLEISLNLQESMLPLARGRFTNPSGIPVEVVVEGTFPVAPAERAPLTKEVITRQFEKTGGSMFAPAGVHIELADRIFLPLATLNSLRRDLLEKAEQAYLAGTRPDSGAVDEAGSRIQAFFAGKSVSRHPAITAKVPALSVYTDDPEGVKSACKSGAGRIYYEVSATTKANELRDLIASACRVCGPAGVELVWKWPRIADQDFIRVAIPLFSRARDAGLGGIMVEGLGLAEAIAGHGPGLSIYGGQGLNITNHLAIEALSSPFRGLTLSPELSADDLTSMLALAGTPPKRPELEIMVQGSQEAMVSEDDLLSECQASPDHRTFYGLLDETNRMFPVYRDAQGRTHISNAVETCLVDHLPFVAGLGLDWVAIDARRRGAHYAGDMTLEYREALEALKTGDNPGELKKCLLRIKERIKRMSMGGITTGALLTKGAEDPER